MSFRFLYLIDELLKNMEKKKEWEMGGWSLVEGVLRVYNRVI